MQQQFEDMEMQIWEYLDGNCSEAEKRHVEQLIASNDVWRQKHAELKAFQNELVGMETEHPSMRFTANVMDSIAAAHVMGTTARYLNNWVVKGLAAFFLVLIGSLIVFSLIAINSSPANAAGTVGIEQYLTSDTLKIVMFINILLALMLLDKLLNKRRERALV